MDIVYKGSIGSVNHPKEPFLTLKHDPFGCGEEDRIVLQKVSGKFTNQKKAQMPLRGEAQPSDEIE